MKRFLKHFDARLKKILTLSLQFTWHPEKAARNLEKHGISFLQAQTVFNDPYALIVDDPNHSSEEHREIIMGHSNEQHFLIVSFTERTDGIRIISARFAEPKEKRYYAEHANF